MKDRLASIIKQISGRREVTVKTELTQEDLLGLLQRGLDPDKTWFQRDILDPKTRQIKGALVRIPEKIFESHENVAKGKAAHEAGHAAITRFGRFVPDSVIQELGFHHLLAAAEELSTDQVVRDRYEGAGKWVDQARKDSADESELLHKTKNTLGYIPKSIQLNTFLIYARQYEEIPERFDADIIELYKKLKPKLAEIEHMLPTEDAPEEEVLEKSKERYRLTYKNIWPEAKKLVAEDLEKEKLRQMLQNSPPESDNIKSQEKSREKEQKEQMKEGKDNTEKEMRDALQSLGQELKKELDKLIKKQKTRGDKTESTVQDEVPMRSDTGNPIPMDQLSKELLEALKKAYEKLPEYIKQILEERARKVLEKLEDQFIKELSPELAEGGETHEEYQARLSEEKEKSEIKKEKSKKQAIIDKEIREIERRQAAASSTSEIYEKTYQEIRELDEILYRELEEVFTPNIKRTMKLRSSGAKINLPAVFRRESSKKGGAGQIDNKIFETTHLPEKKDYAITLLNDLSGSMDYEGKAEEDFKAKVLFAEVFNRLGVKNEILGFQDKVIVFKRFDQELNDEIRKKMSGMLLEVLGENPGGHNFPNLNDDGPCLLEASKGLDMQPGKEKFLIVISDGYPTGPYNRLSEKRPEDYLKEAVEYVSKNTDQKLIGLGLGQDTEHVKDFYPTSFPNITVKELSGLLSNLLKDMIINPRKYTYQAD